MKKILVVSFVLFFSIVGCSQTDMNDKKIESKVDSVSYAIGIDIGKNFKMQEIEITPALMLKGINDAIADTSMLSEDEIRQCMMNFQMEMTAKQQNKQKLQGDKNKVAGDAFFAENKTKEGVITLPSGLQYKIITSGAGESPKLTSTVDVHYAGRLLDGTEFDSSYKRGTPYKTPLNQVIKGWTDVLQLMKVGDKWEVYIPSDLAYGERGSGPTIGPNSALIFVMELVSIN